MRSRVDICNVVCNDSADLHFLIPVGLAGTAGDAEAYEAKWI